MIYFSFKMFFFNLQTYVFIFKNITVSVPGAIITGAICILLLIALKFVSEKLKHKMKFPLPAELIVVSEHLLIHESCYFLSGFKSKSCFILLQPLCYQDNLQYVLNSSKMFAC